MADNDFATYNSRMNLFRQQQAGTDVKFVCKNGTMDAHREVLSARSAYFNAILICDYEDVDTLYTLNFVNIPVEVMEVMLHFIYTGEMLLETNREDMCEFKTAIDKRSGIDDIGLFDILWGSYVNMVNVKNFVCLWYLADICGQPEVNLVMTDFMVKNGREIVKYPEEVTKLNITQMTLYVSYAVGRVFGDLTAEIVIKWGNHDRDARLNVVHEFIDQINWVPLNCVSKLLEIDYVYNTESLKDLLLSKLPNIKPLFQAKLPPITE